MSKRFSLAICDLCSLRSYSSGTILQRAIRNKAFLDPPMRLAEKSAKRRAEMQSKAALICQSWPPGTSLVESPSVEAQDSSKKASNITNMTTNFMIYVPNHIQRSLREDLPTKQQIKQSLRILLLKRSATASPLPSAWTAISGRLERTNSIDTTSSEEWETPLDGALREIKEETNQDAALFKLEAALPPSLVSTPEGRQWRVWPILWSRTVVLPKHIFRRDEFGNPSNERASKGVMTVLRALVRLNDENVEFSWKTLDAAKGLSGVVPGLLDTFERVLEHWMDSKMLRRDAARKKRLDDIADDADADADAPST